MTSPRSSGFKKPGMKPRMSDSAAACLSLWGSSLEEQLGPPSASVSPWSSCTSKVCSKHVCPEVAVPQALAKPGPPPPPLPMGIQAQRAPGSGQAQDRVTDPLCLRICCPLSQDHPHPRRLPQNHCQYPLPVALPDFRAAPGAWAWFKSQLLPVVSPEQALTPQCVLLLIWKMGTMKEPTS